MKRSALSVHVGVAFVVLLLAGSSHAGGLYLSTFGSPSMGTASAGANAIANDASTAVGNPAGMTRLDDHKFLTGLAPGFATVKFKADANTPSGGTDGGDQGGFIPISSTSYVHKLSDRWRLGMSLQSFSGASLDPNDDWAGRFEVTEITLFTVSFLPTVAVRVTDWLSVGAGAAITYGRLDMRLHAPPPVPANTTIRLKNLDDWAAAPVASVLIEPTPELRFGVVYQGETEFNLDGKIKIPVGAPSPALELELPLARAVRASVYWDATDEIALVMNSGWEDWSTAKSLPASTTTKGFAIPLKFRDTWYLGVGGYYKLNDAWTLQSGFRYDSSALKDKNRTTGLPVDRAFTFAVGGLYDYSEKLRIGVGFSWTNLGSAPINRPTVKGKYSRNEVFLFNLSFNWKKLPWSGRGTF
ncbi:MAG: outer membrane protein transport protein [Deltaproteobacteria bacterium]|nr:outer membrane protein transport protein [Deltaproteobacteria bacterium]